MVLLKWYADQRRKPLPLKKKDEYKTQNLLNSINVSQQLYCFVLREVQNEKKDDNTK